MQELATFERRARKCAHKRCLEFLLIKRKRLIVNTLAESYLVLFSVVSENLIFFGKTVQQI